MYGMSQAAACTTCVHMTVLLQVIYGGASALCILVLSVFVLFLIVLSDDLKTCRYLFAAVLCLPVLSAVLLD